MSAVRFVGASFAYGGSSDVFTDLSLAIDEGFTGVVGENGGGKTTLLRVIAGELSLSSGKVLVRADVGDRFLCRQRVERCDSRLIEFAGSYDRQALRWQSRLGVHEIDFGDYERLSPGERKRWQLACALSRRPSVLLLDEPTNHLDASGRELLLSALESYDGVCVVVSHDRELLDALCTRTIRIQGGGAQTLPLPYSEAREVWQADLERQKSVHAERRRRLRKSEIDRARLRDQRARAERSISARTRIKGPKDSDARSVSARGRAEAGEAALARRVSAATSRSDRLNGEVEAVVVDKMRGTQISFRGREHARRWLAVLDGDLCAGERVLARDIHVELARDSRIRICGDNGAGKTTLLESLLERAELSGNELLYVPQLLIAAHESVLRQQLARATPAELGMTMAVAASLGLDPERVLASQSYSPGQLRKLLIADGLAKEASLIVLDEPTNHLDLPSIERLEAALLRFRGALVVVSHDNRFAGALELDEWHVSSAGMQRGSGGA